MSTILQKERQLWDEEVPNSIKELGDFLRPLPLTRDMCSLSIPVFISLNRCHGNLKWREAGLCLNRLTQVYHLFCGLHCNHPKASIFTNFGVTGIFILFYFCANYIMKPILISDVHTKNGVH